MQERVPIETLVIVRQTVWEIWWKTRGGLWIAPPPPVGRGLRHRIPTYGELRHTLYSAIRGPTYGDIVSWEDPGWNVYRVRLRVRSAGGADGDGVCVSLYHRKDVCRENGANMRAAVSCRPSKRVVLSVPLRQARTQEPGGRGGGGQLPLQLKMRRGTAPPTWTRGSTYIFEWLIQHLPTKAWYQRTNCKT